MVERPRERAYSQKKLLSIFLEDRTKNLKKKSTGLSFFFVFFLTVCLCSISRNLLISMSLSNQQKQDRRLKYVSVPQDNFKFQEYGTKRRKDSDDLYGQKSVNINYPSDDIDYRIKINEICLFSQHNESEWKSFRRRFETKQLAVYIVTVVITLCSLGNSIWLLFFSRFSLLLHVLDIYEKLNNELIEHSLIIYFSIELCNLLIDIVRGFYLLRLFQLLNLKSTFGVTSASLSLLRGELDLEEVELEEKLVESVVHLKMRIQFRKFFTSIRKSLTILDMLIAVYFFVFVFAAKYMVAIFTLVDIPSLKGIYSTSEKFDELLQRHPAFNEKVYATFSCGHFPQFNQTEPVTQSGKFNDSIFLELLCFILLLGL